MFSAVSGGMQWIAVKPVDGQWGVCTFVYSKVTPPQPELKCCSCSSYHCLHITTLAKGLEECHEDDDSPLALFKLSLEISPEMRDYFEMATRSEKKVLLFAAGTYHNYEISYKKLDNLCNFGPIFHFFQGMKMMQTILPVFQKRMARNSLHLQQMAVVLVVPSGMVLPLKMSGWMLNVAVLRIFIHFIM